MTEWPRRWRARWIWWEAPDLDGAFARGEAPARPLDGFGYLRRTFTVASPPRAARCRITCDGRYVVWVNGAYVGRGPIRSQPWSLTYDTYDVGALLRVGDNVVAVLTRHYGGPTVWWQPALPVGALGFGSLAFEAEIDDLVLVSDAEWRVRIAPYERFRQHEGPPPNELLDGRAVPYGWTEIGFDDSAWARALLVQPSGPGIDDPHPPTEPFGELDERPIAALTERLCDPVVLDNGVYDFGGIVDGHPIVSLGAEPGAVIELRCGEGLLDGEPVTDVRDWRLRYTAAGVAGETVEAFEPVGFRYVRASVVAGRAAVRVNARERRYPRAPGAAFACSDPVLDEIWRVGVRTLEVCSTDAFIDCPGREQRAWLGDEYGHTLVTLLVNPDVRLGRWMLRLHARGARPDGMLPMVAAGDFGSRATTLPDNNLLWILALARFHEHTGDRALVEELMPVARGILRWFERRIGRFGLLADVPGWVFVDWARLERDTHRGVLDALFVLACDAVAALSGERIAIVDLVREAFERYWDEARGVYVDTLSADGAPGRRVSQHTNALALVSGCAPRARWAGLLEVILDADRLVCTPTPADPGDLGARLASQVPTPGDLDEERQVVLAQPFFSHFVHAAIARAGGDVVPLVRRWAPLTANGTFGEYWDSPPGRASLCHAWSSVPLHDLATYVLGVRASHSSLIIEPHLGDLDWAEGTVSSAHGWVRARIERDGSGWIDAPSEGEFVFGGRRVPFARGRVSFEPAEFDSAPPLFEAR